MVEEERNALLIACFGWLTRQPYLPKEVFEASLKFRPAVFVEVVNLFNDRGWFKVLLSQRHADEKWPGQWHSPGKFLREGWFLADVLKALAGNDEAGFRSEKPPIYAGTVNYMSAERGRCVVLVFVRLLKDEPKDLPENVRLFPVAELPDMVEGQGTIVIPMAMRIIGRGTPIYHEGTSPGLESG